MAYYGDSTNCGHVSQKKREELGGDGGWRDKGK